MTNRIFSKGFVAAVLTAPAIAYGAGQGADANTVDLCSNQGIVAPQNSYRAQFSGNVQIRNNQVESLVYVVPQQKGQKFTTCAIAENDARSWGDHYQTAFYQALTNQDEERALTYTRSISNLDRAADAAKYFKLGHDGLPDAPNQRENAVCQTLFSIPANPNVWVVFTGRTEQRPKLSDPRTQEVVAVLQVRHDKNEIAECRFNGENSALLIARLGGASDYTLSTMRDFIHERVPQQPKSVPEILGTVVQQQQEEAAVMAQRTQPQQIQALNSARQAARAADAIHFSFLGKSYGISTRPNFELDPGRRTLNQGVVP